MSGFRVDGCGATDHFKKIKSLGIHTCPSCKNETEFFLDLVKFKIDIFFIPTVTLKSRYAVMCSKCGNGEFCSGEWAANLMNTQGTPQVIFESNAQAQQSSESSEPAPQPAIQTQDESAQTPQPAVQTEEEPLSATQTVVQTQTESLPKSDSVIEPRNLKQPVFKCKKCGVTQLREGKFCPYCGEPVPEEFAEE